MSDDLKQPFIERIFSGSAIATILVALVGQSILSIVYQIINNEQQSAQIEANRVMVRNLETNVFSLATPLSVRVFKVEDRFEAAERRHEELAKRIDLIIAAGTRALGLVIANQQRVLGQIDRLSDRQIMLDRKVDTMEQAIKRLEALIERKAIPP